MEAFSRDSFFCVSSRAPRSSAVAGSGSFPSQPVSGRRARSSTPCTPPLSSALPSVGDDVCEQRSVARGLLLQRPGGQLQLWRGTPHEGHSRNSGAAREARGAEGNIGAARVHALAAALRSLRRQLPYLERSGQCVAVLDTGRVRAQAGPQTVVQRAHFFVRAHASHLLFLAVRSPTVCV